MKSNGIASKPWVARQCEENARGPSGHWEIVTAAGDARDTCIVQCVYNGLVAEYIAALHNIALQSAMAVQGGA